MTDANVFTIPAGAPFLATLARALLDGGLVEGFPGALGPLELASATIYVPTQRAAAALARALLEASGGASLILPRIAPLGAFEPTQGELGFAEPEETLSEIAPPAVGELTRRMTLARLTRAWGEALRGAICRVEADGRKVFDESEAPLVATTPAQAYALAGDLAALIDDLIIEGVDPERLDALVTDAFDPYWRITLDFLKIAFAQWPAWLDERGLIDRVRRGALLIDNEIAALASGASRGPTIIAGSTGTNRATARLIAAIARAPQGAVVLPDLDQNLDERAWAMIGASDEGAVGVAGHPQAAFHRLLGIVGVARDEVKTLGAPADALRARAHYLSEALRPADTTDVWSERRKDESAGALSDRAIAERARRCRDRRRRQRERGGAGARRRDARGVGDAGQERRPDHARRRDRAARHRGTRALGRRVEDSAGRTLGQTEAGVFARLALAAAEDFAALPLIALIAHPLTRLARAPEELQRAARALEIGVFRAVMPPSGLGDIPALMANARAFASDRHAHDARKRLDEDDWRAAEALLRDAEAASAPLRALGAKAPLGHFIAAHRAALDAFARGEDERAQRGMERGARRRGAQRTLRRMGRGGGARLLLLPFRLRRAVRRGRFRPARAGRAQARIRDCKSSACSKRACSPSISRSSPGSTKRYGRRRPRPTRSSIVRCAQRSAFPRPSGASARPRTISSPRSARARRSSAAPGSAAARRRSPRDFSSAWAPSPARRRCAPPRRAAKPTSGSRARSIAPKQYRPAPRPEPRPPRALRPDEAQRHAHRDAAARSLRGVRRVDPAPRAVGADRRRDGPARDRQCLARGAARVLRRRRLRGPCPRTPARGFSPSRARVSRRCSPIRRSAPCTGRASSRASTSFSPSTPSGGPCAERILVEQGGRLEFPLADGSIFTLTARADRIEALRGGGAALIDYKSGSPPGMSEVQVGFAPQLTLEAAMLARGGFAGLAGVEAVSALYFKLGGAKGGEVRELKFKDATFAEIVERHFAGLKVLLDQFADPQTPYLSRLYPKFAKRAGDYDHLARVKEWSATGGFSDDAQGDER